MAGIMVGSSIKGMLVGLLSGWFARKVRSTKWGIALGAAFGLLFAFLVAAMQHAHYLEIMMPGFITGAIIGFLTQRLGEPESARL
jgi:4-amino-4-deoxy-L-arabinose transferase-like glycosyltransferase